LEAEAAPIDVVATLLDVDADRSAAQVPANVAHIEANDGYWVSRLARPVEGVQWLLLVRRCFPTHSWRLHQSQQRGRCERCWFQLQRNPKSCEALWHRRRIESN